MFELAIKGWSLDKDLQIIQADVHMSVEDSVIIEEPLCIDVGLPALLYSALHDTAPNRFAPADEWEKMPFFVCGCGDPECRGFSFVVHHEADEHIQLSYVEERTNGTYRELETHVIPSQEYRKQIADIGETYLRFIADLDYRPYFGNTVKVVEELVEQIHLTLRSE
ncbi:hypothetical protein A8709_08170 [Paenibacillus pectinilyticus]|uniref:Post-SET domain-containing protein n=1 Tax=Paenibacillus pectinilyticus TaxID=512399 RepID=A0A1C1A7R5_9BACL|nr:hypothetical protein [Paenibacillus pectinilyticus]OCT16641.1 hypothetical protein A8709_08170 [Paenibacillus pectinilyticus]